MPRDSYLLSGEKYDVFRTAYRAYVERIQALAAIPDAGAKADRIVAMETAMARQLWSPEQSRDIARMNDPETVAGLRAKAPDFDWTLMLKTAGVDASPQVLMNQNTAVAAIGKLMVAMPLAVWKDISILRDGTLLFLPTAPPQLCSCNLEKALSAPDRNDTPLMR